VTLEPAPYSQVPGIEENHKPDLCASCLLEMLDQIRSSLQASILLSETKKEPPAEDGKAVRKSTRKKVK
jgi:hypothetical protein